jgi:pentatricopeptide repeat protein
MLSLGAIRNICAAFDAVALTVIAAGFSRGSGPHPRRHPFSTHPVDFPTIAACRAANSASKSSSSRRRQNSHSPSDAAPAKEHARSE